MMRGEQIHPINIYNIKQNDSVQDENESIKRSHKVAHVFMPASRPDWAFMHERIGMRGNRAQGSRDTDSTRWA